MEFVKCVFYIIVAITLGIVFALLFIRMDEKWKTLALSTAGLPAIFSVLIPLNDYINITKGDNIYYICSLLYVLFFILTFIVVVCIMGYLIKQQTEKVKVRILDIILGYNKFLESYYESRKAEIDNDLDLNTLRELKKEQEDLKLRNQEKEAIIKKQMEQALSITLPLNYELPIEKRFLICIPGYTNNLLKFYYSIEKTTKMFCDKYNQGQTDDLAFLLGYLSSICIDINTKLFNDSANHIRTHFRVKCNDNYIKFIAFQGNSKFENDLTKIPIDRGLIKASYDNRCSLIKSLNYDLHHKANNDGYWKNYISFALLGLCEGEYPLMSIGISISDEALYNDLLYFINFCQIERIISDCVSQINKVCNIYSVIENFNKRYGEE